MRRFDYFQDGRLAALRRWRSGWLLATRELEISNDSRSVRGVALRGFADALQRMSHPSPQAAATIAQPIQAADDEPSEAGDGVGDFIATLSERGSFTYCAMSAGRHESAHRQCDRLLNR